MAQSIQPPDSLLAALPTELSHGLFAQAPIISLAADQTLFWAGDEGDGCYRLDEGMLKATVLDPGGGERILAVLGPGSVVGELSMIDGASRSASIIALSDSKLSSGPRSDRFGVKTRCYRTATLAAASPQLTDIRRGKRQCDAGAAERRTTTNAAEDQAFTDKLAKRLPPNEVERAEIDKARKRTKARAPRIAMHVEDQTRHKGRYGTGVPAGGMTMRKKASNNAETKDTKPYEPTPQERAVMPLAEHRPFGPQTHADTQEVLALA